VPGGCNERTLAAAFREVQCDDAARTRRGAGGLIIVTVALFQFFVLDPQQLQKRRLTQQINDARTSIKATENALKTQGIQADPEAVKRAYLEALRKQVAEIDKNMQGLQKGLVPPDQMAKLLEGMLARNRGLQLVSLHKLPVRRFESAAKTAAAKPEASKAQNRSRASRSRPSAPSISTVSNSRCRVHMRTSTITWRGWKNCRGVCSGAKSASMPSSHPSSP